MIHRFLTTNWLGLLLGALLAAGLSLIPLAILNARLDERTAERDAANIKVASLSASIERQNGAVAAWKAAAEANREVYLAGLDAANRRAIRLEVGAERIMAMQPPADPAARCDAAADILKEVTQ